MQTPAEILNGPAQQETKKRIKSSWKKRRGGKQGRGKRFFFGFLVTGKKVAAVPTSNTSAQNQKRRWNEKGKKKGARHEKNADATASQNKKACVKRENELI